MTRGETAILECQVKSLSLHHTVSWLRQADVSVLTVGGLVFSSDPRVFVSESGQPGASSGSWTLSIQDVRHEDEGGYQCQVG